MKFSIVTPVLNGMPQIQRCVGSVRNQRPALLEHIVEDGCSKDGTTSWIQEQADLRVESRADHGMYDAINCGWARATGDILSWLNADEQYLPGALERVGAYFAAHPSVDAVFGDYILVDMDGCPLGVRREIPLRRWYVVNGVLYAQSCCTFIRRHVWETGGGFDSSYRMLGDVEWVLRLLGKGIKFTHIPCYLSLFTLGKKNLSREAAAIEELERVRRRYGAYRTPWARLMPRTCRWVEKFCRGCYGRHHVHYRFMQDDRRAENVDAWVGSSWRWPS